MAGPVDLAFHLRQELVGVVDLQIRHHLHRVRVRHRLPMAPASLVRGESISDEVSSVGGGACKRSRLLPQWSL
jgi:hypothetical protein